MAGLQEAWQQTRRDLSIAEKRLRKKAIDYENATKESSVDDYENALWAANKLRRIIIEMDTLYEAPIWECYAWRDNSGCPGRRERLSPKHPIEASTRKEAVAVFRNRYKFEIKVAGQVNISASKI